MLAFFDLGGRGGDSSPRNCAYVLLTELEGYTHTAADNVQAQVSSHHSTQMFVCCVTKNTYRKSELGLINMKHFKPSLGVKGGKRFYLSTPKLGNNFSCLSGRRSRRHIFCCVIFCLLVLFQGGSHLH